jgi:hypothetical protein
MFRAPTSVGPTALIIRSPRRGANHPPLWILLAVRTGLVPRSTLSRPRFCTRSPGEGEKSEQAGSSTAQVAALSITAGKKVSGLPAPHATTSDRGAARRFPEVVGPVTARGVTHRFFPGARFAGCALSAAHYRSTAFNPSATASFPVRTVSVAASRHRGGAHHE